MKNKLICDPCYITEHGLLRLKEIYKVLTDDGTHRILTDYGVFEIGVDSGQIAFYEILDGFNEQEDINAGFSGYIINPTEIFEVLTDEDDLL